MQKSLTVELKLLPTYLIEYLFLPFLVGLAISPCLAQHKYVLSFHTASEAKAVLKKIKFDQTHADSLAAIQQMQQVIVQLHQKSYLLASVDSTQMRSDTIKAYLSLGQPFQWVALGKGNVGEDILSSVGYRDKLYKKGIFSYRQLAGLEEKILQYMDNHGFPFASVRTDSVQIKGNEIQASLHLEKGLFIKFDSLIIVGSAKLKKKFLATYLSITPGQPFSQRKIERSVKLLQQMPYVSLTKPTGITFKNERAYPVYFADTRDANQVDGIVGILPNEQGANKLLITGELNLKLKNLFSSGKSFSIQWQQIKPASPRLDMVYEHPVLFGTPLELKANLFLLKEDSTFLTINRQLSLSAAMVTNGKLSFSTGLKTSQLGAHAHYRTASRLVDADSKWVLYGIGYEWNNVDNFFYPKRGWEISAQAMGGNKRIIKNLLLEESVYTDIRLSSPQFSIKGYVRKYTRASAKSIVFSQLSAGKVISANLFRNDLFRVGGLNSLRGFNENALYASTYAVGTVEYRYFMDADSFIFGFYDQALLQNEVQDGEVQVIDTPLGTGIGLSLLTKAGTFNLVYAVGNSKDRKFGLNYSKIHFGIVNRF